MAVIHTYLAGKFGHNLNSQQLRSISCVQGTMLSTPRVLSFNPHNNPVCTQAVWIQTWSLYHKGELTYPRWKVPGTWQVLAKC